MPIFKKLEWIRNIIMRNTTKKNTIDNNNNHSVKNWLAIMLAVDIQSKCVFEPVRKFNWHGSWATFFGAFLSLILGTVHTA